MTWIKPACDWSRAQAIM